MNRSIPILLASTLIIFVILALFVVGVGQFLFRGQSRGEYARVVIGKTIVIAEIADTPQQQQQGLSDRAELSKGTGMLFVFKKPDYYAFWMKDMKFPIDIIWIDADWSVVDITERLMPESYPSTVRPEIAAQYVLEVPAGFSDAHYIEIGEKVTAEFIRS